jgi:uncharacterized RDD family membrane protein YckC
MEKYHTAGQRIFAGFVDGLLFMPLSWVDSWMSGSNRSAGLLIAWMLISYPAYWLYSVLMHGFYGQTLGKMALKVKVLDASGEGSISMKQAFWRDSIYVGTNTVALVISIYYVLSSRFLNANPDWISPAAVILWLATMLWFVAEILTCLTNKKRRALHDFIAGTVVVRTDYVPLIAVENSANSINATGQ